MGGNDNLQLSKLNYFEIFYCFGFSIVMRRTMILIINFIDHGVWQITIS